MYEYNTQKANVTITAVSEYILFYFHFDIIIIIKFF